MAEEEQDQGTKPAKRGGLIGVIAAVALAAAGGGGYFAWQSQQAEPEPGDAVATPAERNAQAAEERAERRIALEPLVVNLGGGGASRYLKVQLELEVVDVASRGAVEVSVPVLRDALIVLLGSQRLADLQEFEGKVLLKEEILDRMNGALGSPLVDSVLFTEFIVQ
ncbi:MAG: flagellar basal body-associated FliL family protein [Myxococcota bacterium]